MKKLLLFSIACVFIGFPMRCEIVNDTLPTALQFGDTLLLRSTSDSDDALRPPQVTLPSPQSQIFTQYINHKITEYNGLPEINIPLYEINVKGLTIPVALSYHAGGVRFMQYDGDTGAGWSISATGYRVSRTVNNKPDEASVFYNKTAFEAIQDDRERDRYLSGMSYRGAIPGSPITIIPNPYSTADIDGEYDLFTYSAPTTSAHFIISDRSNLSNLQTAILEASNDLVSINVYHQPNSAIRYSSIPDISITDDKGNRYNYGGKDEQQNNLTEDDRVFRDASDLYYGSNTAWMLKQIQTPYNEEIQFRYASYCPITDWRHSSILNLSDAQENLCGIGNLNYNHVFDFRHNPLLSQWMWFVKEIETAHEIIRFTRYGSTSPFEQGTQLIKEITVTNKLDGQQVKKIVFHYENYCYHNLLTSIDICTPNTTTPVETHTFEYYRLNGNNINDAYPDQWGYYKFNHNPGKNPYYMLHEEFNNDEYLRNSNGSTICTKFGTHFDDYTLNRSENTGESRFLTLKQITFPTGGTTEYEYEPNQFFDEIKGREIEGGGQRIRKITSDPKDGTTPVISEFKYGYNENGVGHPNIPLDYRAFVDEFYNFIRGVPHSEIGVVVDIASGIHISATCTHFSTLRKYTADPQGDANMSIFNVSYPQVAIYEYDTFNHTYNGKTVSQYSNNEVYSADYMLGGTSNYLSCDNSHAQLNVINYYFAREPKILFKQIYDKNTSLVTTEEFKYQNFYTQYYEGMRVRQKAFVSSYGSGYGVPEYNNLDFYHIYEYLNSYYQTQLSDYVRGAILPVEKTTILHENNGAVTTVETYAYNDKKQIEDVSKTDSKNGNLITHYTYPLSNPAMIAKNMVSPIIKTTTSLNNTELSSVETIYPQTATNNMILPLSVKSSYQSGTSVTEYTCDLYDNKGNIRQVTGKDGISTTYLWGYLQKYPIAEIKNATYSDVTDIIAASTLDDIAAQITFSPTDLTTINNLRTQLPNAQVTTFTYKPLIGIETITDPRGVKITYHYDDFGRLKYIKDENNKTIENYEYHYKNQ